MQTSHSNPIALLPFTGISEKENNDQQDNAAVELNNLNGSDIFLPPNTNIQTNKTIIEIHDNVDTKTNKN